jgi:hypothetical protein
MNQVAVAAPAERQRAGRLGGVAKAVLSAPLTITIVGAILGSQLIPAWTNHLQDHRQRLQVRTQVANDMTNAFTSALAGGPSYGYGGWRLASARVRAELTARYGNAPITAGWHRYAQAVSLFLQSGSQSRAAADELLAQGGLLVREEVLLSPRV